MRTIQRKHDLNLDRHPLDDELERHEVHIMLNHYNGQIKMRTESSHDWTWDDERIKEQFQDFCTALYDLQELTEDTPMDEVSYITETLHRVRKWLVHAGMEHK